MWVPRTIELTLINFLSPCVYKFLTILIQATETLSAKKRPTLYLVIPIKMQLIELSHLDLDDSDAITNIKLFFSSELESQWIITKEHLMGMILHPNLKTCTICPKLKDEFYNVLKEEIDKRPSFESETHKKSAKLTTSSVTPKRKRKNLLSDCYDPDSSIKTMSNAETEIEK
ncbi:unnamed protein product [Rotaria sp. Silwood2]|nr:unnamed protein product [Rotaria sp. Silwood2]CAF2945220.1 unnamed protein product [Rotaria sp. Silwood2]CAF3951384.1 unnamed protein product [Rotaria sp. Silwood2]CAF4452365.1 unnamed protein product [Rotaria sp. Silwood2]CAF4727643.1 unnamed protein product [Rotaria sp. Silwood2]